MQREASTSGIPMTSTYNMYQTDPACVICFDLNYLTNWNLVCNLSSAVVQIDLTKSHRI